MSRHYHPGEPLSARELRYHSIALRVLRQHEHERPDYDTCTGGQHPCPWASCPNSLLATRGHDGGVDVPHDLDRTDIRTLKATCALDVIREGGASGREIAEYMGVTRSRGGQMVDDALGKLRRKRPDLAG